MLHGKSEKMEYKDMRSEMIKQIEITDKRKSQTHEKGFFI